VMNEHEKSDGLIVPKKPPNKVGCDRLRRWWREGGWPREGRSSMTRTGLSAGLCVPNMLSAHVSATFAAPTYDPRWEPDAVIPHVRICGGGGGQPPSLLLPNGNDGSGVTDNGAPPRSALDRWKESAAGAAVHAGHDGLAKIVTGSALRALSACRAWRGLPRRRIRLARTFVAVHG
jgi:hypothetical protein